MPLENRCAGVSKSQDLGSRQGDMNPVAAISIRAPAPARPPILDKAPGDIVTIAPKRFRLFIGKPGPAALRAYRDRKRRIRFDGIVIAFEAEIQNRAAAELLGVIAEIEHRRSQPATEELQDRRVAAFKRIETEACEPARLGRGENSDR